ncbi:Tannase/feruloyl esterase [Diaporthe sp. PMI_573]|nr:Tannase/feruloyl esterase [Diaporthaceae sp. PMI_573]
MNAATAPLSACAANAFSYPTVFGAEILGLTANLVQNYSTEVSSQFYYNNPSISVKGIDYCNVTVTYTHPGQDDTINVETWLPMKSWNGRLQAVGGGGWVAGRFFLSYTAMAGAVGQGYVATTTDAGIGEDGFPDEWALNSPGNDIITNFYGQPANYSYWNGCSQGGRQGFMLAQRYPNAYDGIAASAPAFNWAQFIPATSWAQVMMGITGQFPPKCELDAITDAAVAACDPLDGVTDGLISDPDACSFDPFSMVGKAVNCTAAGEQATISHASADIANLTWTGPRKANGGSNGTCVGVPIGLGEAWLKFFVQKSSEWDYTMIHSVEEYTRLFQASVQQYDSIIGTSDSDLDLSGYREAGGKLITYHGLADGIIPVRGTSDYYKRVLEETPDVADFFRYFEVPGLGHCAGGVGGQPTATFQALVDWVEKGVVPDTLPITFNDTTGTQYDRILCPYPERAHLISDSLDPTKSDSYRCST